MPGTITGQPSKVDYVLPVIVAPHDHSIKLNPEPRVLGSFKTAPHVFYRTPARQLLKFVRVDRIDTYVDSCQAGVGQRLCQFVQQETIRSHCHRTHARGRCDPLHDAGDIGTHGWLAAGQAELVEAQIGEDAHQAINFIILQQLSSRSEGHVFRHAVNAAQITFV
ncbi:MAG: hypothetical protein R3350_09390, partial [Saprospiraceae bacterium]|nr:hypothetical protein [Saprospiraceae bacterium]